MAQFRGQHMQCLTMRFLVSQYYIRYRMQLIIKKRCIYRGRIAHTKCWYRSKSGWVIGFAYKDQFLQTTYKELFLGLANSFVNFFTFSILEHACPSSSFRFTLEHISARIRHFCARSHSPFCLADPYDEVM